VFGAQNGGEFARHKKQERGVNDAIYIQPLALRTPNRGNCGRYDLYA
jgi:hypothetical protein